MLFILGIMTCLLGAVLGVLVLLYQKLDRLTIVATNQQAEDYVRAAQTPKTRQRIFAPKTLVATQGGRSVKETPTLVDMSELDPEVGIKALEDYGDEL